MKKSTIQFIYGFVVKIKGGSENMPFGHSVTGENVLNVSHLGVV